MYPILTESIVMGEIEQYREEWERDGDWWWGITNKYSNAPYGYDVNVYQEEEGGPLKAVAYKLGPAGADGIPSATWTYGDIVLMYMVPTKEEYKERSMLDINNFKIDKKTMGEIKASAIEEALDIDYSTALSCHARKATRASKDCSYTLSFARGSIKNEYAIQVYEGTNTRCEYLILNMFIRDGSVTRSDGLKVYSLVEAMANIEKNHHVKMIDLSNNRRSMSYDYDEDRIVFGDGATMRNAKVSKRVWIEEPDTARSASLMALHRASYYNGKLVSVDGKKDMLVSIGDCNISGNNDDEYLVAVYKVNKEK